MPGWMIYYVHKHAYVYGRDWIDYVRNTGAISRVKPVADQA